MLAPEKLGPRADKLFEELREVTHKICLLYMQVDGQDEILSKEAQAAALEAWQSASNARAALYEFRVRV